MSKGQLNIKLSTATIAQIKALAARRGESQANVVSIAVDRMAQAEEQSNEQSSGHATHTGGTPASGNPKHGQQTQQGKTARPGSLTPPTS